MASKKSDRKARAVGINHVALEVGEINAALEFYGSFLEFEIQSKSKTAAFIYFGDQFINLMIGRSQGPDTGRHFGIAVDDKELARSLLESMGVEFVDSRFLDFLDPWGNRIEITTYENIQFTKADHVLQGMGLGHLIKTDNALSELKAKGMVP
jgi:catechol 2,3-dioxygenase-like lactoylglutathione lyase family enzyme